MPRTVTPAPQQPQLLFDGECEFCRQCVEYARRRTGNAVDYQPYQALVARYPQISEAEFRAAIQLIEADGSVTAGAAAAFRALELGGSGAHWARWYRRSRLFAALSEAAYRWVSRHRALVQKGVRALFPPKGH